MSDDSRHPSPLPLLILLIGIVLVLGAGLGALNNVLIRIESGISRLAHATEQANKEPKP